jgi:CBS domain-containing protein
MSAAAVVSEEEDFLLGNLSASHLKGVRLDNFSQLGGTVREVIETMSTEKKMTALAAHLDTPLHYVLYHLKASHMHRCWVVEHCTDESKKLRVVHIGRAQKTKLIGLITLTDICKTLVGVDTSALQ